MRNPRNVVTVLLCIALLVGIPAVVFGQTTNNNTATGTGTGTATNTSNQFTGVVTQVGGTVVNQKFQGTDIPVVPYTDYPQARAPYPINNAFHNTRSGNGSTISRLPITVAPADVDALARKTAKAGWDLRTNWAVGGTNVYFRVYTESVTRSNPPILEFLIGFAMKKARDLGGDIRHLTTRVIRGNDPTIRVNLIPNPVVTALGAAPGIVAAIKYAGQQHMVPGASGTIGTGWGSVMCKMNILIVAPRTPQSVAAAAKRLAAAKKRRDAESGWRNSTWNQQE